MASHGKLQHCPDAQYATAVFYMAYLALSLLLFPVLVISLLLYAILLLPFAIATALICVRPDVVPNLQSYGTIMHTLMDDARILVEPKTEKEEQETPRNEQPKSEPTEIIRMVTRKRSFISDFDETSPIEPKDSFKRTRPKSRSGVPGISSVLEGNSRESSGKHTPIEKPFDFTNTQFSPHWSVAAKHSTWSPGSTPPKLALSRPVSPPHWPSPVPNLEPILPQSPDSAAEYENFSPIRSPLRAALEAKQLRSPDDTASHLKITNHTSLFSTSISDALRSTPPNHQLVVTHSGPLMATPMIDGKEMPSTADILKMPENHRQAWIARFRELISELERHNSLQYMERYRRNCPSKVTPPPLRPSAFPHTRSTDHFMHSANKSPDRRFLNRMALPKLSIPVPQDSPSSAKSNGSEGLYGAENEEPSYWQGFDQSFESITTDEGHSEHWRFAKWQEKGVRVMKPLDEESGESNSGASVTFSSASKKGVKWKDQAALSSPMAKVIPRHLEPSLMDEHQNSPSEKQLRRKHPVETGLEPVPLSPEAPSRHSAEPPHTPVRVTQVLGKTSNSRELPGSPLVNSPTGSVSGKLIQMYEELSRTDMKRPTSTASGSSTSADATRNMTENKSFPGVLDGARDDDENGDKQKLDEVEASREHEPCVWIVANGEVEYADEHAPTAMDKKRTAKRAKWEVQDKQRGVDGYDECF